MHDDQLRSSAVEEARARIGDIESSFDTEFHELDYARKLYLIENCIYAIDKEPIATQITKLRFFITLIVDQKLPADPSALENRGIRSLPNLETKIVAADSLLPPYADAQQLDGKRQNFLFEKELDDLREDLLALRHDIMLARGKVRKARLRAAYRDKRREIAGLLKDAGFEGDASERLAAWDPFDQNISTPFFEPEWMFGVPVRTVHLDASTPATLRGNFAILNETSGRMELPAEGTAIESGFDIVVANPPYVRQETIKAFKSLHAGAPAVPYKDALKIHYECFSGTADLYVYFYERALRLVRPGGVISFITSNKYYRAGYGAKLRPWLARESRLLEMIDFGDAAVFTAIAYPTIIFAQRHLDGPRAPDAHEIRAFNWDPARHRTADIPRFAELVRAERFTLPQNALAADGWRLGGSAERKVLERLRATGPTLGEHCHGRLYRGVLTGLNEAFVVERHVRDDLIKADPKSAEILKPFLRGRDIKRWRCEPVDLWLIFTRRGIDISCYPAIRDYLKSFKRQLTPGGPGGRKPGSYEWYEIQDNIAYYEEFAHPKIIVPAITDTVNYAADSTGYYSNDKTNILVPESVPYVLGILNSSISFWIARQTYATKQGGFYEFKPMYISEMPIPRARPEQQSLIEQLVTHLIWLQAHPPTEAEDFLLAGPMVGTFEKLVEAMVYELFFEHELHAARLYFFKLIGVSEVPPLGGKSASAHRERLTAYFQRISSLNHPLREALFALPALEIARLIEPPTA